jgi:hypothetical protein
MQEGLVYVAVNSAFPDWVKVGRTTRPPAERMAELSSATGVPVPYVLAYHQSFADCVQAELDVHRILDEQGLRVAANREFFHAAPAHVIEVVRRLAAQESAARDTTAAPSAAAWLAQGDAYLFGLGDIFQHNAQALQCYRQAASRGCLLAPERLGAFYAQSPRRSRDDRKRALAWLSLGAERGNYYCYVEMGMLYASDPHPRNFAKAWDKFFAGRAAQFSAGIEAGENRYMMALRRYVCGCIDIQALPEHVDELRSEAAGLVRYLGREMRVPQGEPDARMRMAGALRWTYGMVLPQQSARQLAGQSFGPAPRPRWLGFARLRRAMPAAGLAGADQAAFHAARGCLNNT